MTMKHTKEELASKALTRLDKLIPRIYEFTERGIAVAKVQLEGKPHDVYLFSHIVRYEICQSIDALSDNFGIHRTPLPLSGIELFYEGFKIKVWKADGGEMPLAGASPHRQDFLSQKQVEMFEESDVPVRLAILWGCENGLTQLYLACPKKFDSPWENGACHFNVLIPHPATQVSVEPQIVEEPSGLDDILQQKPRKKSGTLDND
jgi:hypothetical protein